MHTITVPEIKTKIRTLAEDGVPIDTPFFYATLKMILNKAMQNMRGTDVIDFAEDIYKPLKQVFETEPATFTIDKDKHFNAIKKLVEENQQWHTNQPGEDIPTFINAFKTAVRS
jgi:hypothetical protein